jgi:hypothetical protein
MTRQAVIKRSSHQATIDGRQTMSVTRQIPILIPAVKPRGCSTSARINVADASRQQGDTHVDKVHCSLEQRHYSCSMDFRAQDFKLRWL